MNTNEPTSLRVLVLANEKSSVVNSLTFLQKRGYKIKICSRLMDAVGELTESNPDILLISWNLKRTDVRKAYNLIASKFDTICIVFGEENTPKTARQMMASGIALTMLPPISGPSMHMRIQSLMKKFRGTAQSFAKNKRDMGALSADLSPVEAYGDTSSWDDFDGVPSDTQWTEFRKNADPTKNVWQGVHEKDGKKNFYYFQGAEKPVYEDNSWKSFGSVKIMTHSEEEVKDKTEMMAKLDAAIAKINSKFDDSMHGDFAAALENAEVLPEAESEAPVHNSHNIDINDDLGAAPVYHQEMDETGFTVLKFKDSKSKLAQGLRKAVSEIIIMPDGKLESVNPIHTLSKVIAATLKTPNFNGYLIAANANDAPDTKLMMDVLEKLKPVLMKLGEPMEPVERLITMDLDPIFFMLWAEAKADFFVRALHEGNEIAYAYLPFDNMPEIVDAGSDTDSFSGIKINSLFPGKPINFELFMHMPKNNKYLLYQKESAVVDAAFLSKLIKFGVRKMFIKKEHIHNYEEYCVKNKLEETYEDYTVNKKTA